ncbi:MAG TPA: site-2 protease family protein [Deltaproteobacteria bacterium]|jgi:Zn-dependent protease|nr:site-2 protease family protein [Deltaproteobacteria bacterium]
MVIVSLIEAKSPSISEDHVKEPPKDREEESGKEICAKGEKSMFGRKIRIFKLFGFSVFIDLSWIIIAVLVTWSLAQGYFPYFNPGLSAGAYWVMGVVGALGLFLSVIFHEMSHSLVARRFGLPMRGITLFIFGGVSEMTEEPRNPKTEFSMAIAGPVSSIVIGFLFYGLYRAGLQLAWSEQVWAVLSYLAFINFALAVFNLIPAYPLDGGRVLRSGLWSWKGNLRWATRTASRIGSGFGMALIILGVLSILTGNFIGGLWWFLIGLFLRNASSMSYTQLLLERALKGEPIRDIMNTHPVSIPSGTSIDDLVHNYFYRYHYKMFPVQTESGKLEGCITLDKIKSVPKDQWKDTTVEDVASGCAPNNTVDASTDALNVMAKMNREGVSKLLVTEDGALEGIVTLKDLFDFFSIKADLEGGEEGVPRRR